MKINNKALIKITYFLLLGIITIFVMHKLNTNSKIVCGRFTRQSTTRGMTSFYYSYSYDDKIFEGGVSRSELKKIPLDSLKKIDCVKIEVSNYSTFFNRFVDERVLK